MQSAVPLGEGGMLAVLGAEIEQVKKLIQENIKNIKCFLANDNTNGQLILSGRNVELDKFASILKEKKIKNIKLPVSAPFHCELMGNATRIMRDEINKIEFDEGHNILMSNVTADTVKDISVIKDLLIRQIENRVRWRESVVNMINNGVKNFIEIGPGKVLSGLIKRIDRKVNVKSINSEEDIKNLDISW